MEPHTIIYASTQLVLCIVLLPSLFLCISHVPITLYVPTPNSTHTRQLLQVGWGCPWLIRLLMILGYIWLLWLARSSCCWTLTLGLSRLVLVWTVGLNADRGYIDGLGHVKWRDFLENGSREVGASKIGVLKLTPSQITVLGKKMYFQIICLGGGVIKINVGSDCSWSV